MRNKPRIRFKGFTEDWEQRKLGAMCSLFTDGDWIESKDQSNEGIRLIQTGNIGVGKFIDKPENKKWISHSTFDNLRCKELLDGDILISRLPHPAGRACIVSTNNEKWITAVDCTIVRLLNRYSNKFILQSLCTYNYFHLIDSFLAGGTRQRVSRSNLSDINIMSPEKIEQDKIGLFFECVDNLITLHQRKLEKLKLAKKALLQKLFPKNGSQFPEIRFKGFTDAWEQRKLIDTAKTFIGLVTTMTENYRDSGTLLIRNSDIKEGQFVFSEKPIHLDEEFAEKNKTRRLQIGDVVTVHTGDIGTSAVIQEKEAGAIGFATINTRTDKRILNPYFLSTYFNTEKHKCYANSVSTGDGRSNYNIKDFNKLVISIPTLDEQEKISLLINNINTIITLHQCKLDKLQDVKKGLLQKMFV